MSVSFRVTAPIATVTNEFILKQKYIFAEKQNEEKMVRYIIGNIFNAPFKELKYYIDQEYNPCDIFILTSSVKSSKNFNRKTPT